MKKCRIKVDNKKCKEKIFILLFCKSHWKSISTSTYAKTVYIIGIALLFWEAYDRYNSVFSDPIIEVNSTLPWECNPDRNQRGILLSSANSNKKDSIHFILGPSSRKNDSTFFGLNWKGSISVLKQRMCFFPKGLENHLPTDCNLQVKVDSLTNRILFTGILKNSKGEASLIMEDSQFVLNNDCLFTWNQDDRGFEILDSYNRVIFSINYVLPNEIWLRGILFDNTIGKKSIITGQMLSKQPIENNSHLIDSIEKLIVPLFVYTGEGWVGKRNPNFLK
ncbi:hypothetical protein [Cellulophaga sp. Hel_I_12]|uniref:hypothetical protein n=1 Tax=Cellulophaga sp. Hel_I_12 TaxID=1249972 RepID=UPI0012E099BC|nr:hypothetical protein [Cellulophaga sp. Hel_I_12]